MFKRFVFRLLLAAFGFLLVPTSYWHACEQDHTEHSDQSSIDQQHASCSICDFDLFQLDAPEWKQLRFEKTQLPLYAGEAVKLRPSTPISCFNKGPPAVNA